MESWLTQLEKNIPTEGTRFVGLTALGQGVVLAELMRRTDAPLVAVFATGAEARAALDHLCFFAGEKKRAQVHYLPSVEFDFFRGILPNPEVLCERNVTLFHALNDPKGRLFIANVASILQKGLPPLEFLRATQVLRPNEELDREQLIANLVEAGYQRQPTAFDPGVFSVRGGVIDIFSPLYPKPLRVEFFGDLIEDIRLFDPQSQRSLEPLPQASILPIGQTLIPHGTDLEEASEKIKRRLDSLGVPKATREELILKIRDRLVLPEFGLLFPLLSKGSAPLLDYFPKETRVIWQGEDKILTRARETELPHYYQHVELYEKEPTAVAERGELFLSESELRALIKPEKDWFIEDFAEKNWKETLQLRTEALSFGVERDASRAKVGSHPLLEAFAKRFREWMDKGFRVHIVCHTRTHAERIRMLFENYSLRSIILEEGRPALDPMLTADFSVLNLWQGAISDNGIFPLLKLVILSEEELFGQKKRAARSSHWSTATDAARLLSSFKDLKIGDYIVHKDHGIGRYLGLKSMNFLEVPNDYVLLEYKDGDKLYVPVYRLNVLQKYAGADSKEPVLDKLGGDRWLKVKSKAQKAIAELAAEFLKIQARRKLLPGFALSPPGSDYGEFEMRFPFDETPDQLKAIEDVNDDLSKPHPMDRLVCGDVGYGKTEIALRASYRAVLDKKQVAVLVPTTVLAFQHFETFKKRFTETGARVETVSRLRSSAEIKKTLEALAQGKVDVIVGTHRLLSSDVQFKDLGLVVIDEEHRFGVVHKERLKKLAESVHVLSMTATPIPRTLNMAMTGIKEISIITTPPPDRLSVRTFVCRRSDEVIIEAISNELARGGQVFFVHNRIETIFELGNDIKKLLPKVHLEIAHGQMDAEELEQKMLKFYGGEIDVLLSTAIIESGLDIPRANTILIDQADRFGLAQLYQLRGRVGRSEKRAYCYLLVPPQNLMTEDAKQRLQVIQRYTDLGAGFNVASHDLEIRGAGDLLGKDQSGHLTAIGVDLYFELLEESVQALQGKGIKNEIEPEINLRVPAFFPADYLPDISERIAIYRRLSEADSEERISEVESEIRDRFGTLPEEVTNLIGIMVLKMHLKKLHVLRLSSGPKKTSLQFAPSTPAKSDYLVKLVQSDPKRFGVTPDHKLVFTFGESDWKALLNQVQQISHALGVA